MGKALNFQTVGGLFLRRREFFSASLKFSVEFLKKSALFSRKALEKRKFMTGRKRMSRKFTAGAWVFVAPHEGARGQETFGVSGQFLGPARGDATKAVIGLVNPDYKDSGVFNSPKGGARNEIVVPVSCLSPKW